jgi:hypothetical protein
MKKDEGNGDGNKPKSKSVFSDLKKFFKKEIALVVA